MENADSLIRRRKEAWAQFRSIGQDKKLRADAAERLLTDRALLEEVRAFPEKLIELVFTVVDKNQKTMPFFLNTVQQDFITTLNRARADFEAGRIPEISLLILKGRQQGFTTLVTAYQLSCSLLNRNFQGFTLADKSDNAESIFQNKAKFPYSQLPPALKPTEKYNNRKQLLFEKLNSSWAVDTATRDVGRSRTVNFFHGSECAFWKDGIAPIQGALGEAFTKNCVKIYESTANGYNDYQKMWDSGVHINCFYEWWRTEEYRLKFPGKEAEQEFLDRISTGKGWIWERLRWLKEEKQLAAQQLYWYWNKFDRYLDKELIKQEYPCTPKEAFLLSGKNVFHTAALLNRLEQGKKPVMVGLFHYDYDGLTVRNIRFVSRPDGCVRLYRLPDREDRYCIGGDTAGEGSDYFTGQVISARTGEQAAVLRHQFDPDLYARQMYCLGKYYGDALLGIEANFDTYPIMELRRLGYPNQYTREVPDAYTGQLEKRFGFKTTVVTRPAAISRLIAVVREHSDTIHDRDTVEELLSIIRTDKGRVEAPPGGHDDLMMALAIAHQIRDQVVFTQPEWETGEEMTVV